MADVETIRIGTRGSPLALAQAHMVREALGQAAEIRVIKTTGDHILDRPLSEIGGKGLFTKEIEEQLADHRIDIAVHSMKDMPTALPEGLVIGAMLERADPRDALVSKKARSIAGLPENAHVGTASLRRGAILLARRPDLRISTLRGSVQTRLKRIEEGAFDATLLARAGLDRLGMGEETATPLDTSEMLPAVAQGAIGIEYAVQREDIGAMLEAIHHEDTGLCVDAERAFLAELDGSCRTPIAAHAVVDDGKVAFRALVARPDGSELIEREATFSRDDAVNGAAAIGREVRSIIGSDFFAPAPGR
ncbi:MAG: hydroxymethylbilane synthase [Xanthobacteraceae bacterium]